MWVSLVRGYITPVGPLFCTTLSDILSLDCIRTFTWDKKLESWVKEKGFAGGGGKKPTVTSPREYKHRFREAMERYVLEAPRYVCPSCADFFIFLGLIGGEQID